MKLVNVKSSKKKKVNSFLSLEDDIFNIPALNDISNNLKQKGLVEYIYSKTEQEKLKYETRKSFLISPACKTCSD